MPRIITHKVPIQHQFTAVNDERLRTTLIFMADRLNERVREIIYRTYNDPEIMAIYRGIRASQVFEKGGKSKVWRKTIEFPNTYVYEFVDTVMREKYGPKWLDNKTALKEELVRPWWVVEKL